MAFPDGPVTPRETRHNIINLSKILVPIAIGLIAGGTVFAYLSGLGSQFSPEVVKSSAAIIGGLVGLAGLIIGKEVMNGVKL